MKHSCDKGVIRWMFGCLLFLRGCWSPENDRTVELSYDDASSRPSPFTRQLIYPYRMDDESLVKFRDGLRSLSRGMLYNEIVRLLGSPDIVCDLYDHRHIINIKGRYRPIGFSAFYIISQYREDGSFVQKGQTAIVLRFNNDGEMCEYEGWGDLKKYDIGGR